jgi:hypothetical protein
MKSIDSLVEQHIRESDSHLRHIDALVAKAARPQSRVDRSADVTALLVEIKTTRDRLSRDMEEIRGHVSAHDQQKRAKSALGLKSVLKATGEEYEKTLAAIFDTTGL